MTPEIRTTFRPLRNSFQAAGNCPPGFGVDTKLIRLDDSFTTPPATEWADFKTGGMIERTLFLSRVNDMHEICQFRGPSTTSLLELAERAGNALPPQFADKPVLFFRPHLDANGKPIITYGTPVGSGISGVTVNPDPAARWVRFVFNVLKWNADPTLKIVWSEREAGLSGNSLATLDANFFQASVIAIDSANLVPEFENLPEDQVQRLAKPATGTFAVDRNNSLVLVWTVGERRFSARLVVRKEHCYKHDGLLVEGEPSQATWLPSGWALPVFPTNWTRQHVASWFVYGIETARNASKPDDLGITPGAERVFQHAKLICEQFGCREDMPLSPDKSDIDRTRIVWDFLESKIKAEPARGDNGKAPPVPIHEPPIERCTRFEMKGGVYVVSAFGEKGAFSPLLGFHHLARLIRSPGIPVAMSELLGEQIELKGLGKQPVMDAQTKNESWKRHNEIDSEIEEAKSMGDSTKVGTLMEEKEKLRLLLLAASGLAGEGRTFETKYLTNARSKIRKAINLAIDKLREAQPPLSKLAEHFEVSVVAENATYVYRPSRREMLEWNPLEKS